MLDEPSAGLSPVLVDRVSPPRPPPRYRHPQSLLIEQLIEKALNLADRVYALARPARRYSEASTDGTICPIAWKQAYFGGTCVNSVIFSPPQRAQPPGGHISDSSPSSGRWRAGSEEASNKGS